MKCPRCKTPELLPTMIEEYLPAMGCGTCHGSLVSLLYYRQPPAGVKLISSSNRIVAGKDVPWRVAGSGSRSEMLGGRALGVRETLLSSGSGRLVVWQWYWIGGEATASDVRGKLMQVRQKLLHGRDDGAVLMAYAPYDVDPAPARAALRGQLAARLAPVEAMLLKNIQP